ncbi:histidine kinase [Actinoplanes sp. NPDC051851]|uniref:sensor histidine kinase n=1 Tax=Actinoplanes sp. NPDC051851 TaxID=3154753 RepID=UPI00341CF3B1
MIHSVASPIEMSERERWPAIVESTLAVLLTGLAVATLIGQHAGPGQVVLGVLTIAPLAFVLRSPVAATLLMMSAVLGYALLGFGAVTIGGNGIIFGFFAVVVIREAWWGAVLFPFAMADVAVVYLTAHGSLTWPEALRAALTLAAAWALGLALRRWIARTRRIAVAAAEAATAERLRIAREMHDFIAHHLSVVTLQSGLATMVLESDPATARQAMDAVAAAGHEALAEMRQLLGVLREDGHRGLGDVPGLLDRLRGLGLEIDLTTTGTAWPMTSAQELCAYRVLQESLTNVLKHAGRPSASVLIAYRAHEARISITNDIHERSPVRTDAASFGLLGMRERAAACGGTVDAGPTGDGGFRVDLALANPVYPSRGTPGYPSRETTR